MLSFQKRNSFLEIGDITVIAFQKMEESFYVLMWRQAGCRQTNQRPTSLGVRTIITQRDDGFIVLNWNSSLACTYVLVRRVLPESLTRPKAKETSRVEQCVQRQHRFLNTFYFVGLACPEPVFGMGLFLSCQSSNDTYIREPFVFTFKHFGLC